MKPTTLVAILTLPLTAGIGLALAQPSSPIADRDSARTEALARRAERVAAVQDAPRGPDPGDEFVTTLPHGNFREDAPPGPDDLAAAAGCASGSLRWRREAAVEVCAKVCTDDEDCSAGERCRVVQTRATGPHALQLAADAAPLDEDDDEGVRLCDASWADPGPVVDIGD